MLKSNIKRHIFLRFAKAIEKPLVVTIGNIMGVCVMAAEKNFEQRVKRWLESQGIYRLGTAIQDMGVEPCGYWEKRHGSAYTGGGLPDLHIVVNGISIEVELKAPHGRPSELQKQKLNQIDSAGCIGLVLYPRDFEKFQKLILHIKTRMVIDPNVVIFAGLQRGCKV